jgi:hypothetical protein
MDNNSPVNTGNKVYYWEKRNNEYIYTQIDSNIHAKMNIYHSKNFDLILLVDL